MIRYILKRLLMMIPVLLGVIVIVFTIMYLTPGDPARMMLGAGASEEAVQTLRTEMGLDDSYIAQLFNYILGVVQGDLGRSLTSRQPVLTEILDRFPTTLRLAVLSVSVSVTIGLSMGIISATRQYSIFDKFATATALIGVSMPTFWAGLMAMIVFSVWLGWLPASGAFGWQYWIMPSAVLGFSSAASIMRMTRSSMLEVIRQDYIRTARAKGQKEIVVIIVHALRNALLPVITVVGMQFGFLLGGAVLIETVFSLPGLGNYIIRSIGTRDHMVVQGGVLLIALSFSLVNLVTDIIYGYIDPRLKSQYAKVIRKRRVPQFGKHSTEKST